ncbi:hypothetical protein [Falsirhodobacter deserti]|uniref:hypothetical protein n=1 Tax=Falsirhodobacter deserti TaxID=1365611 RepID=UPI000FE3DE52|nr:hypothetical protein [Falsirhodobacter deserti]
MNSLRILITIFLIGVAPMAASGDELDRYETSLGGSERLRLFALTNIFDRYAADPAVRDGLRTELARQGYYYDGTGSRVLRQDMWIAPILAFDGNINGGTLNDRFRFAGLEFHADPRIKAKPGWVGGASVGARTRFALGNGSLLDLQGEGKMSWSPRYDIGRSSAQISACLLNNLRGWTFLDLCHRLRENKRKLGRSTEASTSARLSSLGQVGNSYHEAWLQVERLSYGASEQGVAIVGLRSIFDRIMPYGSVSFAQSIPNEMAFRSRIELGVQLPRNGRIIDLFLWTQSADGDRFLGAVREDQTHGVGVSVQSTTGPRITVSFVRNSSTADFYDHSQLEAEIRLRDVRW